MHTLQRIVLVLVIQKVINSAAIIKLVYHIQTANEPDTLIVLSYDCFNYFLIANCSAMYHPSPLPVPVVLTFFYVFD